MVRIYARSLLFALRTRTQVLRGVAVNDIKDGLVKLRPLHFHENADKNLSAVVYFQRKIFKCRIF